MTHVIQMRKVDTSVPHGACCSIDPHKDIHFKFIFVIYKLKSVHLSTLLSSVFKIGT